MSVLAPRLRAVAVLVSVLSLVLVGLAAVAGPPAEASGELHRPRQRPAGVRRGSSRGRERHARSTDGRGGASADRPTRSVACCSGTSPRATATGSARTRAARRPARSRCTPTAAAPWNPSIYDQSIPDDGYAYLTTRDGTQLAYTVHPPTQPGRHRRPARGLPVPSGPDYAPPYPTLIEYSGYGYANPAGPNSGIAALANLMGFAVVDVNMRGTGCSGGAFDFFEPLQSLDGYDVIETIARQPWVKGHKVGMMGISYGGISQLFTAQTPAAAPRGDLTAVGARRHRDDALPGRHPQHRLRRRVGQGAPGGGPAGRRRRARAPSRTPSSGSPTATRPARPTRRCTARRPT